MISKNATQFSIIREKRKIAIRDLGGQSHLRIGDLGDERSYKLFMTLLDELKAWYLAY
ncbi:MAG: hypothetical protein NO474_02140 [Methanomassiliicoccales archaeon]|nr:hypothetical protein [Methanomassiliicoccales archaeon]